MSIHGTTRLLDPLFATDAMRAVFSERARIQRMLDFAAALARAEARSGVIPAKAASAIQAECRAEPFDLESLARDAASAGNLAIPLIKQLTERVRKADAEAAGYVHWGATSQDMIDTALVLQLCEAFELIERDLARLSGALAALADRHRTTALAGRTWLQQAVPVTLGLKVAGWLDGIERHRARLRDARPRALSLQFGGAAGTLAALYAKGIEVSSALAGELELGLPDCPWHTQRDRLAEVATVCGLIVGSLGKIARDVSLMMQTEVGETFEPSAPGKGGSSTMPHKRNPVGAAVALAAAFRVPNLVATMLGAMVQEHERGLGGWHAEWETLPEICGLTAGALAQVIHIVEGLEVDAVRMRANLDATDGLIFAEAVTLALGVHIGRQPAHEHIQAACRQALAHRRSLRAVLGADAQVTKYLSDEELDRLFEARNYLGCAEQFIERVLSKRV